MLEPALPDHSRGLTRAVLVGEATGSVHTGLILVELEDGYVDTHVHSFESSFFVLEGDPVLYLDGRESGCVRTRAAPSRSACLTPGGATGAPAGSRWPRPAPAAATAAGHLLPRCRAGGSPAEARPPRPAQPAPLPARRRRHGRRPAQPGNALVGAEGVGEHGDGRPALQRDHREDAGRQTSRRAAAHDVHGRLPARRPGAPARSPVRGVVLHARGRGRRRRRRGRDTRCIPGTCSGPQLAASTRSTRRRAAPSSGSRPRRPARPTATRTGSSGTGSL